MDAQSEQRKRLSVKVTEIPYAVLSEVCKMMNIKDFLNYNDFRKLAEKIGLGRNMQSSSIRDQKNPLMKF